MNISPAVLNALPVEQFAQIALSTKSIEGTLDRAQQYNRTNIESPIEIKTLDELCVACNWLTMTMFATPKSVSAEENVIAARILELSDRLGGFIKPPLNNNT